MVDPDCDADTEDLTVSGCPIVYRIFGEIEEDDDTDEDDESIDDSVAQEIAADAIADCAALAGEADACVYAGCCYDAAINACGVCGTQGFVEDDLMECRYLDNC